MQNRTNSIQGGTYQPAGLPLEVAGPVSIEVPLEVADPPSGARLQRCCTCPGPTTVLMTSLIVGMVSAFVFGIGTGTADSSFLIAGGTGLIASGLTILVTLNQTPETYTVSSAFGDYRMTAATGTCASVLSWGLAALATFRQNSEVHRLDVYA